MSSVRSGHHSAAPAPGPTRPQGSALGLPIPAPGFTRRIECVGEVCLVCDERIFGLGIRFRILALTTHAHVGRCAERVLAELSA